MIAFASDFQWGCLADQASPSVTQHVVSAESSSLLLHSIEACCFIVLKRDLFVYRDDSTTSEKVIMLTEKTTKCFVPLQKLRARLASW